MSLSKGEKYAEGWRKAAEQSVVDLQPLREKITALQSELKYANDAYRRLFIERDLLSDRVMELEAQVRADMQADAEAQERITELGEQVERIETSRLTEASDFVRVSEQHKQRITELEDENHRLRAAGIAERPDFKMMMGYYAGKEECESRITELTERIAEALSLPEHEYNTVWRPDLVQALTETEVSDDY